MRLRNSCLRFSLKIQLFSEKLLNKKIFGIKFLIKKAIFIFGVRWPLTGRTVTQLDVLLQPLLLRSEISLFWRTSCARDFFFFRGGWGVKNYSYISRREFRVLSIKRVGTQKRDETREKGVGCEPKHTLRPEEHVSVFRWYGGEIFHRRTNSLLLFSPTTVGKWKCVR